MFIDFHFIQNWILAQKTDPDSHEYEKYSWAVDEVINELHESPDKVLEFIDAVLKADNSMDVLEAVGAGPLEDLINNYGDRYLSRITQRAKNSEDFRIAMKNVWVDDELPCKEEIEKIKRI